MTLKCEQCGTKYEAKRHYIPELCDECDRKEGERAKREHGKNRPHQRSEAQKRREPF